MAIVNKNKDLILHHVFTGIIFYDQVGRKIYKYLLHKKSWL